MLPKRSNHQAQKRKMKKKAATRLRPRLQSLLLLPVHCNIRSVPVVGSVGVFLLRNLPKAKRELIEDCPFSSIPAITTVRAQWNRIVPAPLGTVNARSLAAAALYAPFSSPAAPANLALGAVRHGYAHASLPIENVIQINASLVMLQ